MTATDQTSAVRGAIVHVRRHRAIYVLVSAWLAAVLAFPTVAPDQGSNAATVGRPGGVSAEGLASDELAADPSASAHELASAGPADASAARSSGPGRRGAGSAAGGVPSTVPATGAGCRTGAPVLASPYARPCIPAFSGDNGGATYRGVTRDRIKVVDRYHDTASAKAQEQVFVGAGFADGETARHVRNVFLDHFNKVFQLYGRKVELVDYKARHTGSAEAECTDAAVVAEELKAFAAFDQGLDFSTCAAQRKMVVFNSAAESPESFFAQHHPYLWSALMDCERTGWQTAEYVGKRLLRRPARWAGDPVLARRTRKIGVYLPDHDMVDRCMAIFRASLERDYGGAPAVTVKYLPDAERLAEQAQRAVIQFKEAGVTSVVLAADPVSVAFMTQAATSQNYRPEWVTTGVLLQTVDLFGRTYDQSQVDGHMFGRTYLGPLSSYFGPQSEPGRLYKQLTGREIPPGTDGDYYYLIDMFDLLQGAGPVLTPDTMARGAAASPPLGDPLAVFGVISYNTRPDGRPGLDHTREDTSVELFWDGRKMGDDGKPGAFVYTNGGRWYGNGEWPATEPPVYPSR